MFGPFWSHDINIDLNLQNFRKLLKVFSLIFTNFDLQLKALFCDY